MPPSIDRRTLLGGAGAAMFVPLLGSMPSMARASGAAASKPPVRLIFLNFGFGPSNEWYPDTTQAGRNYTLTPAMEPLARHRDSFSVLSNLTNLQSTGTGSHWGSTTFLTGANVRRTPGREFHNDISCDQVAAKYIGQDVRFPSLTLTGASDDVAGAGPGASLAWDALGNPIQGISDHLVLFSKLFGDGGMTIEQRRHLINQNRSVLDTICADAKSLERNLSANDKRKLNEYYDLVRDIETNLARDEEWLATPKPDATLAEPEASPLGTPGIELMFDLMVAALQTDSTRVISYRMPSNSLFQEFAAETGKGVTGAHRMTHSPKGTAGYDQLVWRDRKLCDLFGTLLDKMKAVREPDGSTLLDNSLIVMGSSLRTGHRRQNLPILFAGGGGGGVRQGQHAVYEEDKGSLCNLWYSMLKHVGCPVKNFVDGDHVLSEFFS